MTRAIILARTLLFTLVFYLWSVTLCIVFLPLLLLPRQATLAAFRFWALGVFVILRVCHGVKVELRGREHMPTGRALIAAKHLCMFDVFAQFAWLPDSCFVMRKELLRIPFFGWYARKVRMVVIDREGRVKALQALVRAGRDRLSEPRQLVIFPEAHRGTPGVAGHYHPGVAALYRDLDMPVHLVATNSSIHWPTPGYLRPPGTIVFEYLEPLPAGLKRADFMHQLEDRIETASNALLSV
jgi:1-acyl-sn-glycerol-3-phosphate acyltransferase